MTLLNSLRIAALSTCRHFEGSRNSHRFDTIYGLPSLAKSSVLNSCQMKSSRKSSLPHDSPRRNFDEQTNADWSLFEQSERNFELTANRPAFVGCSGSRLKWRATIDNHLKTEFSVASANVLGVSTDRRFCDGFQYSASSP